MDVHDVHSARDILPLRKTSRLFSETVEVEVNGVVDVDQKKADCFYEKVTVSEARFLLFAVKADG